MSLWQNKKILGLSLVVGLFLGVNLFLIWQLKKTKPLSEKQKINSIKLVKEDSFKGVYEIKPDKEKISQVLERYNCWQKAEYSEPGITAEPRELKGLEILISGEKDSFWFKEMSKDGFVSGLKTSIDYQNKAMIEIGMNDEIFTRQKDKQQRLNEMLALGIYALCPDLKKEAGILDEETETMAKKAVSLLRDENMLIIDWSL